MKFAQSSKDLFSHDLGKRALFPIVTERLELLDSQHHPPRTGPLCDSIHDVPANDGEHDNRAKQQLRHHREPILREHRREFGSPDSLGLGRRREGMDDPGVFQQAHSLYDFQESRIRT